jgi:hypothetical protein
MKARKSLIRSTALVLIACSISLCIYGQAEENPYLGRWALFLPGGAGWLEIRQEQGYLDGDLLWYGGSPVALGMVTMNDDAMIITRNSNRIRERDSEGNPLKTQTYTTWIECVLVNDVLVGTSLAPGQRGGGITTTMFTGSKIPDVPDAPDLSKLKFGKEITLFNGKDQEGWTLTNPEQTNGWKVVDGVLINDPVRPEDGTRVSFGNLRTLDEFEDFNLKIEVNIPEGSNSGVYLRGIYEVQVQDTYGWPLDAHHMGGLYSRITPTVNAEKPAGEWQTLDITLCDRHVTVILNGTKIIDNQPIYGCTGGALTADEFIPGPIYLQGDHGKVSYRNIRLTPIKK